MILLVTGSNRGIGAAIARGAARAGYGVAVNHLGAAEEAASVADEVRAAGRDAIVVEADVTRTRDVERLFGEIDRKLGRITGLVNNAGGGGPRLPIIQTTEEDVQRVFALNIQSAVLCTRAAIERMSPNAGGAGGSIVNISSLAAVRPDNPGLTIYAAAKGAVDSFTAAAAREVADLKIRINAVRAGIIDTPSHDVTDPIVSGRIAQTVLLRRAGRPEEVANAVLFLLSDAASYITGATLNASGGR